MTRMSDSKGCLIGFPKRLLVWLKARNVGDYRIGNAWHRRGDARYFKWKRPRSITYVLFLVSFNTPNTRKLVSIILFSRASMLKALFFTVTQVGATANPATLGLTLALLPRQMRLPIEG